jgi:hypothetical protein
MRHLRKKLKDNDPKYMLAFILLLLFKEIYMDILFK